MGNKEKNLDEVIKMRRRIFDKKQYLSQLQQLSWRIKQAEELYPLKSDDPEVLTTLLREYDLIWHEFIHIARVELQISEPIKFPYETSSNPAYEN